MKIEFSEHLKNNLKQLLTSFGILIVSFIIGSVFYYTILDEVILSDIYSSDLISRNDLVFGFFLVCRNTLIGFLILLPLVGIFAYVKKIFIFLKDNIKIKK